MKFLVLIASISIIFSSVDAKAKIESDVKMVNNQSELNEKFIDAVSENNIDLAKKLIDQGANVNFVGDYWGRSAINFAVKSGNKALVQLLIDHGANVNIPDVHGCTPLFNAAYYGNFEIVQILINNKSDLDFGKYGTPLIIAANWGYTEIVKLLIKSGADLNKKESIESHTALMEAAKNGHKKIVQLLIAAGADINAEGWNQNHTALKLSENQGHDEIVEILKKAGAKK